MLDVSIKQHKNSITGSISNKKLNPKPEVITQTPAKGKIKVKTNKKKILNKGQGKTTQHKSKKNKKM
jgi:hypothetical protein